MEFFRSGKRYDFMSKRKIFISISLVLILSSFAMLFTKGLNFGIDFAGGTVVQVKYDKPVDLNIVRDKLKDSSMFSKASITEFGSDKEIVIKVPTTLNSVGSDIGDEAKKALQGTGNYEIRRVDMVGPKVGDELREKGLTAFVLSMIVILIYVSYRFEWRFAIASILALVHDVSIAIGMIVLFNIDVNLDILAAILTIVGYSLNDTIIIFDRIREKVQQSSLTNLGDIINEAVSMTLARTTLTSLTTFFVVLTLFVFGGEIISGFSFTLLVGVVVGTYSSIFIAASFLLWLGFNVKDYRAKEAQKVKKQKEKERIRSMYEQGVV
jgi:preprotein translocase subunit SecF